MKAVLKIWVVAVLSGVFCFVYVNHVMGQVANEAARENGLQDVK